MRGYFVLMKRKRLIKSFQIESDSTRRLCGAHFEDVPVLPSGFAKHYPSCALSLRKLLVQYYEDFIYDAERVLLITI